MDTISLKGEAAISLTELNEALSPRWWVEDAGHGRLVIQANGSRAYVYLESPSAFPEWGEVVLVDYTDVGLAKEVLCAVADRPDVVVNNDFGTVLRGDHFVSRIRSDPDWDWRSDPSEPEIR